MSRKRRMFGSKQKAKIALAALQERLPKGEIASASENQATSLLLLARERSSTTGEQIAVSGLGFIGSGIYIIKIQNQEGDWSGRIIKMQ